MMFIPSGFETNKPMTLAEHRFTTVVLVLCGLLVAGVEYPGEGWWIGLLFIPLAVMYYIVLIPVIMKEQNEH